MERSCFSPDSTLNVSKLEWCTPACENCSVQRLHREDSTYRTDCATTGCYWLFVDFEVCLLAPALPPAVPDSRSSSAGDPCTPSSLLPLLPPLAPLSTSLVLPLLWSLPSRALLSLRTCSQVRTFRVFCLWCNFHSAAHSWGQPAHFSSPAEISAGGHVSTLVLNRIESASTYKWCWLGLTRPHFLHPPIKTAVWGICQLYLPLWCVSSCSEHAASGGLSEVPLGMNGSTHPLPQRRRIDADPLSAIPQSPECPGRASTQRRLVLLPITGSQPVSQSSSHSGGNQRVSLGTGTNAAAVAFGGRCRQLLSGGSAAHSTEAG